MEPRLRCESGVTFFGLHGSRYRFWLGLTEMWFRDGKQHRDDGPAQVCRDGEYTLEHWYGDGVLHRDPAEGAAFITRDADGVREEFSVNGAPFDKRTVSRRFNQEAVWPFFARIGSRDRTRPRASRCLGRSHAVCQSGLGFGFGSEMRSPVVCRGAASWPAGCSRLSSAREGSCHWVRLHSQLASQNHKRGSRSASVRRPCVRRRPVLASPNDVRPRVDCREAIARWPASSARLKLLA